MTKDIQEAIVKMIMSHINPRTHNYSAVMEAVQRLQELAYEEGYRHGEMKK